MLHHIKSSLSPKGRDLFFSIDSQRCVHWHEGSSPSSQDESELPLQEKSKQAQAAEMLLVMLKSDPILTFLIVWILLLEKWGIIPGHRLTS
jgi:hypothetical protein